MEDVRMFIEESLSRVLVEVLVEGKSPTQWWDKAEGCRPQEGCRYSWAGQGEGEKAPSQSSMTMSSPRSRAYFRKYKGVVEDLGDDDPAA